MRKDKNLEYVQKLRMGGVENKAMNYINDLRLVTPSAPSGTPDYLCFTATGESTVGLTNYNGNTPVLFYSTDKKNWVSWDYSTITLNDGESVYFYGENPNGIGKSSMLRSFFKMTGSIAASGNIQTLLSQKGDITIISAYCYSSMFNGCTSLTTAPKLPATTLAENCYRAMFYGCTSLTIAPELPATTLASGCYENMFWGCTSLTTAPELPATALATRCYYSMFSGCSSLKTAPELPATSLANECYTSMFQICTSLTTAPELPATTLANNCYYYMFSGCSSLTTAPELPATTLVNLCYYSMFNGCTSLTTAPELPATTLANQCYSRMFYGCTNLQSVTTYVTEWDTNNTGNWLKNAGTSTTNPTIYCPTDSTLKEYTNDDSGIPTGWTQVDLQ